jgi:hypothetical protein
MLVDLGSVIVIGIYADIPATGGVDGMPGRLYFATDTAEIWYDNGTTWEPGLLGFSGSAQTTVAGSTSGSAVFSQPFGSAFYKKVIILLEALDGTATYNFPVAFTHTPDYFIAASAVGATLTALSDTAVTVSGLPSSGVIVLEGF